MAEDKSPALPEGWDKTTHQEVETHGIGEGFVLFEEIGQSIRGICRTFFQTRHGLAVAIELTQPAGAPVIKTSGDGTRTKLTTFGGMLVNLSLSGVDLARKINEGHRDLEIGVQFTHTIGTKSGEMKAYRVLVFQNELPF